MFDVHHIRSKGFHLLRFQLNAILSVYFIDAENLFVKSLPIVSEESVCQRDTNGRVNRSFRTRWSSIVNTSESAGTCQSRRSLENGQMWAS